MNDSNDINKMQYPSDPKMNPAGILTSLVVPSWIMSTKDSALSNCKLSDINTAIAPWCSTVLVLETKEQPLEYKVTHVFTGIRYASVSMQRDSVISRGAGPSLYSRLGGLKGLVGGEFGELAVNTTHM